jgi:mannose-6-phosphate isomerase-like protein (cupin superfamily)
MDIRRIEDRAPLLEHEGTTTVWYLYGVREAFDATAGGHLELVSEFEVAGGAAVHPHHHPTHEYYYVTSGHGLMTVEGETAPIAPGDLVTIPPGAVHSLTSATEHAPIHCFCFAVGEPGAPAVDYTTDDAGGTVAPQIGATALETRSIAAVAPRLEHEGPVAVWWLVPPRALFDGTAGAHLELVNEFEVAGGGAVHPHAHPTWEFYYGITGRGVMTIDGRERIVGPGDLVPIPPDAVHSIRPIGPHAPVRCFCFAVGLPGHGPYDYRSDREAA